MRFAFGFAVLCLLMGTLSPMAMAQEKSAVRQGFVLDSNSTRILLFRPKVTVGSQSTAGMFEPNADWTQQARDNLDMALAEAQQNLGNEIVGSGDLFGQQADTLAEYQSLFGIVAQSVIEFQFFPGNRLPTKKRKGAAFDWTLGPDVSALAARSGARYGLFIFTEDQFGSTGRKMLQVFAAMGGVSVQSGQHKGFAGLVDLHNGDLLWLNADLQMGGDVRTMDGARRRVAQLLEDFPGSTANFAAPAQ
ncbi:hypothetical protein [Sphingobium estronivorans]|uniref:hypothetical protein n=1 Tax=Sphingobium estronivorans TaxID=1577690 RepID=UPI001239D66F|nr:hypothetical protein [Sphingobium estronivorans]